MNKDFITVPYSPEYDDLCVSFSCGNSVIDEFIRNTDNQNPDLGKTYLWISNQRELIGYYSITTGYIDQIDEYNNRIKLGGSIHITHFAISSDFRGECIFGITRYSDYLLDDCMKRIVYIREEHVGFSFITLKSTEEGHSLYIRHDFEDIEDDMAFSGDKEEKFCYSMYFALGLEEV